MDLFTPVVEQKLWHYNFQQIYKIANGFECDVLLNWAKGFKDRDGKFVKEFQTTFNSSFWELYIFAVLKQLGLSNDFSYAFPDFIVQGKQNFTVEAVIASNAQNTPAAYEHDTPRPELDRFNKMNMETILRLSSSIVSKKKKFNKHYCDAPHVKGKPFVLAISAFDSPHFNS
ncbi:hypothetical protein [Commensalibacter communis]|uniref:hypothetical protein n=1 Tax=Commensalibacter communis TaxID=2972786 RepID=UPI0022FF83B1|nr:hypothetical protein [Commensalibacter communis]CAI3922980.1 unnamed protein product [Commensalibacter communis]CAI3931708.1 unnamed protein product [Commensalibacter communis]